MRTGSISCSSEQPRRRRLPGTVGVVLGTRPGTGIHVGYGATVTIVVGVAPSGGGGGDGGDDG